MTTERPRSERWDGSYVADLARKRRAWLALTPAERFEVLDDGLDFAAELGVLTDERRRRTAAAASGLTTGGSADADAVV